MRYAAYIGLNKSLIVLRKFLRGDVVPRTVEGLLRGGRQDWEACAGEGLRADQTLEDWHEEAFESLEALAEA